MFRFQASRWRWTFTKNGEEDTEHAQGNQNRFCGPVMRSNCCCNSHSTTKRVSCKKGSISSAARTQACSLPLLLLLLLWDVVGRWRHRFGKYADSPSTWKWEGCVFGFLHPETRFQKSAFSGSVWTVGQNDAIPVRFCKRALSSGWGLKGKSGLQGLG